MKDIIKVVVFYAAFIHTCYAQEWQWAIHPGVGILEDMVTDDQGNLYSIGKFNDTIFWGSSMHVSNGNDDIFVSKVTAEGQALLSTSFGGTSLDGGDAIAVDELGNVYALVSFRDEVSFGDTTFVTESGTGSDGAVLKLNADLEVIWARHIRGASGKTFYGLDIDEDGNCFVLGNGSGQTQIQGTTFASTSGFMDPFVAKYGASGDLLWAKNLGGSTSTDQGFDLVVDGTGNAIVTGQFKSTANFDGETLSSSGDEDIFISKYSTEGVLIWTRRAGGVEADWGGLSVAVDEQNAVFVTGPFRDKADFLGDTLENFDYDFGLNQEDIFVLKLNAEGEKEWVQQFGSLNNDRPKAIAVNNTGVYVSGTYVSSTSFGDIDLTGVESSDIFIAKLSEQGEAHWALTAGNLNEDATNTIIVKENEITLSGYFKVDAVFGDTTFYNAGSSFGAPNIFAARIVGCEDISGLSILSTDLAICEADSTTLEVSAAGYDYQWYKNGQLLSGENEITLNVSSEGTYSVLVSNGCASSTLDPVVVATVPLPDRPLVTIDGGLLTSSVAQSYQWYKDGLEVSGATEQSYEVTESGSYQVEVSDGQCFNISDPITLIFTGDAIVSQVQDMEWFPNPFQEKVTLRGNLEQIDVVRIWDAKMSIVYEFSNLSGNEQELDLGHLESGLYAIEIQRMGTTTFEKLIKH